MNKNKIIISLFICLALIFGTSQASALTQHDLEKQIQALLTQIHLLQQQIIQLRAQAGETCPFITVGLARGYFEDINQEVKELQKLLKQDSSIYPGVLVTGYFGRLTEAALKKFQVRYRLAQTGIVDEATRQKLCNVYFLGWETSIYVTTTTAVTTTTTLQPINLPDLSIVDIAYTPAYPQRGQTVNFTIKVKNSGLADAGNHKVEVYMGNQLIYQVSGTVKAGTTEDISFIWRCPSSSSFDSDLKIIMDSDNKILESNENNNQMTKYLCCGCLLPNAKPDLVIEKILFPSGATYLSSATYSPNEEIRDIKVYIKNQGSKFSDQIHYTCINIDGRFVMSWSSYTHIWMGESIVNTSNPIPLWQCPASGGVHQMQVIVDCHNDIDELNENNNGFTTTINCGAPVTQKPDLIITTIQITPTDAKAGDYVNFVITEKNQGTVSAGRHYIGWYQNDSLMGASLVYGLTPGTTTTYSFSNRFSQAGTYSIKAKADAYNEVSESNETNNESSSYTLAISAPQLPDLIIDSISADKTSLPVNTTARISVKEKNIGQANANPHYVALYKGTEQIGSAWVFSVLAPNTTGLTYTWNFNCPNVSGNYTLKAKADDQSHIAEVSETNNEKTITISCTGTPLQ